MGYVSALTYYLLLRLLLVISCHRLCVLVHSYSYYFAPPPRGRNAKYRAERLCASACMSVASHISKTTCPNYTFSAVRMGNLGLKVKVVGRSKLDAKCVRHTTIYCGVLWVLIRRP